MKDLSIELLLDSIDIERYNELVNKHFSSNDIEFTPSEVFNYFVYENEDELKSEPVVKEIVGLVEQSISFISLDPKRLTVMIMKTQSDKAIKGFLNQLFRKNRLNRWNSYDTTIAISYLIQSKFRHITFKRTVGGPLVTTAGMQANWNIYIKKYLGDATGAPATLIPKEMMSIYNVGTQCVQDLFDGVRVFDNAKPVDVVVYLTKMVSAKDSIVLDFFSGSATTAHAVMLQNFQDVYDGKPGKRKFIMVQWPEKCDEKSEAYKAGYKNICEIGKERIRRAGEKELMDIKATAGSSMRWGQERFDEFGNKEMTPDDVDIGFRVFKLDDSNMKDVYYTPDEIDQDMIAATESNIKEDRTDLDLLFGCLLDWGLPLSMPYHSETIDGCTVHTYNDGDLIACFNENIPDTVIKEIARRKPLRAVFRDSSFATSPEKINVGEIFKLLAPDTRVKVI